MTENMVFPIRTIDYLQASNPAEHGPDESDRYLARYLITERMAKEDLKWYLVNKYQELFIGRLTGEDLEELQYYLRWQYDAKRGWNYWYLKKFIRKLRGYMHEEILKREIAGIETVLTLMRPDDLIKEIR